MKKKSKLPIIVLILLLILVIGMFLLNRLLNRTHFNEETVSGNTGGNYYNGGLFCENGDLVYFSNPYDEYRLYQMTPQGKDARLVSDDNAAYINADDNYLYYVRNNGRFDTDFSFLRINTNSLCRINKNGKRLKVLDAAPCLYSSLAGNYVYYIHYDKETASTAYKVKIDGSEQQQVDSAPLLLSPAPGGSLCFAGVENDHNIRLWNVKTDSSRVLYSGVGYHPVDLGDYIYFMDGENDYHVTRFEKSTGTVTELTGCRVDCFNMTQNYLYYQKSDPDSPALCRIAIDGSGKEEIVAEGAYCDINVTSENVYFRSFSDKDSFFQTPADAAVSVVPFAFEEK